MQAFCQTRPGPEFVDLEGRYQFVPQLPRRDA
jgi:hypothetical protein